MLRAQKTFLVITAFLLFFSSFISCNFDNNEGAVPNEETISMESENEKTTIVVKAKPVTTVVKKSTSTELKFEVEANGGNLTYQWYESADGTTNTGTAIENENQNTYIVSPFTERGIRYFYCVANVENESTTSSIATVAYTELAIIEITTVNNEEPVAEQVSPPEGCYGAGLRNATKVPARMIISKDGEVLYDSGDYEKKQSGLTIKLRGNTSAYSEKKPYKIKLQKKADLLKDLLSRDDSKYKDKDWILLKDATSLNTFVGMTVADIAGTEWTPEFAFVNVIINGSYRGTYLLIEAISKNEKRVNVADDGYIIEWDAYWWNEDKKFITNLNQKYTFKYPDPDNGNIKKNDDNYNYILGFMNEMETALRSSDFKDPEKGYRKYLDAESFAKWYLVMEIMGNHDPNFYYVLPRRGAKLKMYPTWDAEWTLGVASAGTNGWQTYPQTPMYTETSEMYRTRRYFGQMFKDPYFVELVYNEWLKMKPNIQAARDNVAAETSRISFGTTANFERWKILGVNGLSVCLVAFPTWQQECDYASQWLDRRLAWFDGYISDLYAKSKQ